MTDEINNLTQEERDRALTQYGQVLSYLQYENTIYWQRSNFFLIAVTALLAFASARLLPLGPSPSWEEILVFLAVSVVGFLLTLIWWRTMKAADFWVKRWQDILQNLEQAAHGGIELHRLPLEKDSGPQRTSVRTITNLTLLLFSCIWSVSVIYALVNLLTKYIAMRCSQGCP